jgi:hypothetical protein
VVVLENAPVAVEKGECVDEWAKVTGTRNVKRMAWQAVSDTAVTSIKVSKGASHTSSSPSLTKSRRDSENMRDKRLACLSVD